MADIPTKEELMALPPEYLAEDLGHRLTATSIAFIVLVTVVYGLFVASRVFFVKRNGWEIWTLYPLGYLASLGMGIICTREYACFGLISISLLIFSFFFSLTSLRQNWRLRPTCGLLVY